MRLAQSYTERYVSLNRLSKLTTIKHGTLWDRCKKARARFFKFNGVRCIEINCAIDLITADKKIAETTKQQALDVLKKML